VSLIGQAEVTIDSKSRVPIPVKFRGVQPGATSTDAPRLVWVSTPRADGTLWLFPEATFLALAGGVEQALSPDGDLAELNRILFGYSERITEDSAHRLTLPRKHLELVGMPKDGTPKDITLVGTFNHLEIHDRADWLSREAERLARLPDLSARLAAQNRAHPTGSP